MGWSPKLIASSLPLHYPKHSISHKAAYRYIYVPTKPFFCNPCYCWEKGSAENTIGIVRRFLPEKTEFDKRCEQDLLVLNIF